MEYLTNLIFGEGYPLGFFNRQRGVVMNGADEFGNRNSEFFCAQLFPLFLYKYIGVGHQ